MQTDTGIPREVGKQERCTYTKEHLGRPAGRAAGAPPARGDTRISDSCLPEMGAGRSLLFQATQSAVFVWQPSETKRTHCVQCDWHNDPREWYLPCCCREVTHPLRISGVPSLAHLLGPVCLSGRKPRPSLTVYSSSSGICPKFMLRDLWLAWPNA